MAVNESPQVRELNQESLRGLIIAGARRVIAHREHLDRINVFPVPDRDTGTNLALTMRAVLEGLRQPLPSLAAVGATVATSALTGAQGNSGVIFAQFFQGLREEMSDSVHLTMQRFAQALRCAATRAREALAQPREGTILTVITDVAEHVIHQADRLPDFRALLDEAVAIARRSLEKTTDRLAALKRAGVVDAGALGFVHFLEGLYDFLRFGPTEEDADFVQLAEDEGSPSPQAGFPDVSFRYCTEAVVYGTGVDRGEVIRQLTELGDSVVVAAGEGEIHAHVHTNAPAYVLELLGRYGTLAHPKVDDMLASIEWTQAPTDETLREEIALVTDTVCDLPMRFLTENRVHLVPAQIIFGDVPLRDRVDITPSQFYQRFRTEPDAPRTSQPRPMDFLDLYRHLARTHRSILSIHVSAELSGTVQSAATAARQVAQQSDVSIAVVDSRSGSAAEGLVVWAAAEAVAHGLAAPQCEAIAQLAADSVRVLIYVPTVKYFVRGGRLTPLQGKIAGVLRLLPILTSSDGKLLPLAKAFGRRAAQRRVVRDMIRMGRTSQRPLYVIGHSAAPDLAERARQDIMAALPNATVWVTDTTPAIGSHSGPGGLAVAWLDAGLIEDRISEESVTC